MPIKSLPINSRPREKAQMFGIESLSDVELLAILIRNGTTKKDALDISKSLFINGSLQHLYTNPNADFTKYEGIGKIKALELQALFELLKRTNNKHDYTNEIVLDTLSNAAAFARGVIGNSSKEKFLVILVDKKMKVIDYKVMYEGTKRHIAIDTNEVLTYVIRNDCSQFYCFHNHPSGDVKPSLEDIKQTQRLSSSAKFMSLQLIKHLVVCKDELFSEIPLIA